MRQSSIEFLRLVVMFFVLVLHTNYLSIGQPDLGSVGLLEFSSRAFIESFTFIAVIVFVLISGYFSIKPSRKSIINYLFICFFYSVGLRCVYFLFHDTLSIYNELDFLSSFLFLSNSSWFVVDYLALIVISPILNTFSDYCSRNQLKVTIILLLAISTYFGLLTRSLEQYISGFSFVTFIYIYLIGRYLRKYFCQKIGGRKKNATIYVFLVLLTFTMSFLSAFVNKGYAIVWTYTNPLFIFTGVCFFLLFIRHKNFESSLVNKLAVSTFSIYLIHSNPAIVYAYIAYFKFLYTSYPFYMYIIIMLLSCICILGISILIDQLRIIIYKNVVCPIFKI